MINNTRRSMSLLRVGTLCAALSAAMPVMATDSNKDCASADRLVSSAVISRAEAANPNNFAFLSVNGRAVAAATEPCLVSEGLPNCALKKADIVHGGFTALDDEYDMVQSFIFNQHHKTKRPTAVVVFTKTGLKDDSIGAERLRISFELKYEHPNVGTWHWVQYGTQVQCARGKLTGKWVKSSCP